MTDQEKTEHRDMISFKEHIEKLLEKVAENGDLSWAAHYREHEAYNKLQKQQIESQDKALILQAAEYERRMANLNNEAERLIAAGKIVDSLREKLHSLEVDLKALKECYTWLGRTLTGVLLLIIVAVMGYVAQHFVK